MQDSMLLYMLMMYLVGFVLPQVFLLLDSHHSKEKSSAEVQPPRRWPRTGDKG